MPRSSSSEKHGPSTSGSNATDELARFRSRLRDAGIRPHHWTYERRPVCGWESLTETERRVAELVSQGLTNRAVARQMFLSRHTVDFHLRHVFRKLDVTSRVQLARVVLDRNADKRSAL